MWRKHQAYRPSRNRNHLAVSLIAQWRLHQASPAPARNGDAGIAVAVVFLADEIVLSDRATGGESVPTSGIIIYISCWPRCLPRNLIRRDERLRPNSRGHARLSISKFSTRSMRYRRARIFKLAPLRLPSASYYVDNHAYERRVISVVWPASANSVSHITAVLSGG